MSVMRDQRRKANVNEAMSGDDGGFVIVWMALMLLVLLAFCGFGIDVAHWWFVGQKEQRAADAAALAGSIYMPNDLPSAQAIALKVSAQNGYKNGVNATVTATQEPQPSRIRVTVSTTITNFFAGLVGYNTQTITRDAVADFQGPVPMGSPTSKLGQDPDDCDPSTSGSCANFWLNTSGPKGTKREGDRFADRALQRRHRGRLQRNEQPRVHLDRLPLPHPRELGPGGPASRAAGVRPGVDVHGGLLQQRQYADRPAAEQHPGADGGAVEHHERRPGRTRQHQPVRHQQRRPGHQHRWHPLVHRRSERRRRKRQHPEHDLHRAQARPHALGRHRQYRR